MHHMAKDTHIALATEPCGTPEMTGEYCDDFPFTTTFCRTRFDHL